MQLEDKYKKQNNKIITKYITVYLVYYVCQHKIPGT